MSNYNFFFGRKSVLRYNKPIIQFKIGKRCVIVNSRTFVKDWYISLIMDPYKWFMNI